MRVKITLLVSLLFVSLIFAPSILWAKAAYYRKTDMVKMADVIALVTIVSVDKAQTKGEHWTYNQVATAKVDSVLKGELSGEVKLYGGENFICAQCNYAAGKFLVFLKHDGDMLRGVNWHYSIRPVSGDSIEWYINNNSMNLETKPLALVLGEVKLLVSKTQHAQAEKAPRKKR